MLAGRVLCEKCGTPIFEVIDKGNSYGKKIFKSYGVKESETGPKYYCYQCYETLNKVIFKED